MTFAYNYDQTNEAFLRTVSGTSVQSIMTPCCGFCRVIVQSSNLFDSVCASNTLTCKCPDHS